MKKFNFRINLTIVAIVLIMVSCDDGNQKSEFPDTKDEKIDTDVVIKQLKKKSTKKEEITVANWHNEIKKRFGLDISVPQGWSFSDVKDYWSNETVIISFKQDSDKALKPIAIAESIFNATQTLSSDGNFNIDINAKTNKVSKGQVYENFNQTIVGGKMFGRNYINALWYYKKDGVKVASLDNDKDTFVIKLEYSRISV